jgi:hypothetical protein
MPKLNSREVLRVAISLSSESIKPFFATRDTRVGFALALLESGKNLHRKHIIGGMKRRRVISFLRLSERCFILCILHTHTHSHPYTRSFILLLLERESTWSAYRHTLTNVCLKNVMCQNWARPQHTGECSERRAREHYEPALPRLVLCKSPPRAGRKPKRQKLSASVCLHAKCVIYARAQRRSDFSFLSLLCALWDGWTPPRPAFALDFIYKMHTKSINAPRRVREEIRRVFMRSTERAIKNTSAHS